MDSYMLKQNIMKRVRFVYIARRFMRPIALEGFIMAGVVVATSFVVSFQNVFANMLKVGFGKELLRFFAYAFSHSHVPAQLLFVAFTGVFVAFLYDAISNMRSRDLKSQASRI